MGNLAWNNPGDFANRSTPDMSGAAFRRRLAAEPDFSLGAMSVSPSTARVAAAGAEIRVEALTMAVLVTLARARGATVTRDELVEACWQGRIVSDDAVARAISKVRALERAATPAPFTLETVPRIGYRLIEVAAPVAPASGNRFSLGLPQPSPRAVVFCVGGMLAVAAVLSAAVQPYAPRSGRQPDVESPELGRPVRTPEFSDALLVLDESRLRLYLQRGWNPNWKLDSEGNAALHNLMIVCERNPTHDRQGVVRIARLLVQFGADPGARNKWNDTPLIIASSPRFCGPTHPVVAYLKSRIVARGPSVNFRTERP